MHMMGKRANMNCISLAGKRVVPMDYRKQAIYNTLGNFTYMVCLWLLSVVTVRCSGFEDAGVFALAMSIGNVFYFVAMYGMRSFQASDTKHEYSGMVYFKTRLVTVLLSVVLCIGYLMFSRYNLYTKLCVFLYLIFKCVEASSDVIFGELQRVGHLEVCGISMSLKGILSVPLFACLLYLTKNLNYALSGIIFLTLLFLFVYEWTRYCKYRKTDEDINAGTVKGLLITGFPMLLTTLFPIIITAVPRLVLDEYMGKEILGIYSSISTPTVLITTIVPNVLCPIMTYYGECYQHEEYSKILKMLWLSIIGTIILGIVACLAAFFWGDFVLSTIFGKEVLPYMYIFIPMIIATTVYACSMCGNSVLITIRYPKWLTSFAAIALLCSILITRHLVNSIGLIGAVWSFGVPFFLQFVLQILFVSKVLLQKEKQKSA